MIELQEMEAVIEAILFVANDPVPREKLLEVFAENERGMASASLDSVIARYRDDRSRGMMLDDAGGGLRLVSRPELHGYLRRFFEVSGSNKLTMAALESLAIIAYRQPVTGPEIQELRGVNSSGVIKKLLERRLIRIAGRKEVVGKPFLYATTREFLMHFGLRNLKELPPLEQFEELFGGDLEEPESTGEDLEEQIGQEAASLEEAEAEAAEAADREAVEAERAAAEAAEEEQDLLDVDAEPPSETSEEEPQGEDEIAAAEALEEDEDEEEESAEASGEDETLAAEDLEEERPEEEAEAEPELRPEKASAAKDEDESHTEELAEAEEAI